MPPTQVRSAASIHPCHKSTTAVSSNRVSTAFRSARVVTRFCRSSESKPAARVSRNALWTSFRSSAPVLGHRSTMDFNRAARPETSECFGDIVITRMHQTCRGHRLCVASHPGVGSINRKRLSFGVPSNSGRWPGSTSDTKPNVTIVSPSVLD
jgi:hypothetical protein